MPKHTTLQDKLAKSLRKPTTTPKAKPTAPKAGPAAGAGDGVASKISISLHPRDMALVQSLRTYLAGQGHFLSVSEVIKTCIRTAKPKDLPPVLDDLKAEDRRRKG